jgi:ribosomal protein S18 acetylase RimI-like enzyme
MVTIIRNLHCKGAEMSAAATIRPATSRDARGIANVHVESWRSTYSGIMPDNVLANLSIDEREVLWQTSLRDEDFGRTKFAFVAEQGSEIVGFIDGGPARNAPEFEAEIFSIYLLASQQGRGLGRRLMNSLADRFVESGFRSCIVGVLAANLSRGFYEALGARYIHSREIVIGGVALEECFYAWDDLRTLL